MEHICVSRGNSKMGTIPSVSLPAIKTCRGDCECTKICYANRGRFKFGVVEESIARNLRILLHNPDQYWNEVNAAMAVSENFRFHVSGDIPNRKYLENMVKAARKNKHCQVLCFTKRYEMINEYLDEGHRLPSNLHILFSKWRGLEMPNPHKLPEAHVFFRDGTTTASPEAKPCGGHCMNCVKKNTGCWATKKGDQIVIIEH